MTVVATMSRNGLTLFTSVSTTELARDRVAIWDIDLRLSSFPAHNPSPNDYISWRLQPIPLGHYSHSQGTTVINIFLYLHHIYISDPNTVNQLKTFNSWPCWPTPEINHELSYLRLGLLAQRHKTKLKISF